MNFKKSNALILILSGIFLLQLVLILCSVDSYGGADNINHFRIARYAWKYPTQFLDLWGKPVYTTLVFPFSLLGIQFARLFNVLVGLIAILVTIKTIQLFEEKFTLLPVVFIAFSPMYFLLMQSCMTEILFSLVLILSFWLFFKEKYYWAAVVLSFLPFVRSEGIVIFPLFVIVLFLNRKYWAVLFLAAGSLFYTLVGYPHFRDWLWIIHQTPYSMGQSVYGSGSLFHFITKSPQIFGQPFLIFLIIGLILWSFRMLKSFKFTEKSFQFWFLITGSFVVFFAAHSYVWWKGTGGSLGLIRVIASVVPLAAIVATTGFNAVLSRIKNPRAQVALTIVVLAVQLVVPFAQHHIPVRLERPQALMLETSTYLKSLNEPSKIYYFDPYLIHYLDIDPFDQSLSNFGVADKNQPSNSLSDGELIVWDAHFGPNEGGVQLENLMNDPHLQLIKSVLPAENFKVLGGYDYGIYTFRKVEQKILLEKKQLVESELKFNEKIDDHLELIDGVKMFKLDAKTEFSPAISIPVVEIQASDYFEITAILNFISKEPISADAVLFVLSVDVDHKSVSYNKMDLIEASGDQNHKKLLFPLKLNANFPHGAILNLYVWNKDKKQLLLSDLKLTINGY
jgi:ABC-type cobalt transport system substrate-binding protein